MACGCSSSSAITCQTVYPVLSPCACDDSAPIRVEGPDGQDGPKGATPIFSIGTVSGGNAAVSVVFTDEFNRVINWVIPAIPEGVPYTWTAVNTFQQPAIFELGLVTTGGTSTFGGTEFTIVPDATFSGDVSVDGTAIAQGDSSVGGTINVAGNASTNATGGATFTNISFETYLDMSNSGWVLSNASSYVTGLLTLNSCLHPEQQPNVRSGVSVKANATGLVNVGPVDSAPICNPITITVPAPACPPNLTPIVDITIRIGYWYAPLGGAADALTLFLWTPAVAGTLLDTYVQGDGAINSAGGFIEMRARVALTTGVNSFVVEAQVNDASNSFNPSQVTYWITNV